MPQHPGKKRTKRKPRKKSNQFVVLGLVDTGLNTLGNPAGRIHKPGELFAKTRKPGP